MSCNILLISGLVVLVSVAVIEGKDVSEKDLRKNYAKLNKHLERKVKSEDPQTNMAEIERLLNDKKSSGYSVFGLNSHVETLKKLVEFAALPKDSNYCDLRKESELAEFIDSGLGDNSRLTNPNYPLTRLDKVIEYYAYQVMHQCGYVRGHPLLNYGFKLVAYDEINKRLVDELPGEDDVEKNMLKAEEILRGITKDGALADALKQFIKLKFTSNKEYCDERGFEILLKNDLATRRNGHLEHDTPLRRVDKIYHQCAVKHQQICRPVMVETFKSMVKRLSPDTYRKVLGLISLKYVDSREFSELLNELAQKKIDQDYFTPSMFKALLERVEIFPENRSIDIENLFSDSMRVYRILEYVKLLSEGEPDSKYLRLVVDENKGTHRIDDDGLRRVLTKHLYRPCDEFLALFGELVRADNFNDAINIHHTHTTPKMMLNELTYHSVRIGYRTCLYAKYQLYQRLKNEIRPQRYLDS